MRRFISHVNEVLLLDNFVSKEDLTSKQYVYGLFIRHKIGIEHVCSNWLNKNFWRLRREDAIDVKIRCND